MRATVTIAALQLLDEICTNAAIIKYLISGDRTWSFGTWDGQEDIVLFPCLLRDGEVVLPAANDVTALME